MNVNLLNEDGVCMGYLDHTNTMAEKVPTCNPLKKVSTITKGVEESHRSTTGLYANTYIPNNCFLDGRRR